MTPIYEIVAHPIQVPEDIQLESIALKKQNKALIGILALTLAILVVSYIKYQSVLATEDIARKQKR